MAYLLTNAYGSITTSWTLSEGFGKAFTVHGVESISELGGLVLWRDAGCMFPSILSDTLFYAYTCMS